MVTKILSMGLSGMSAFTVMVEADIQTGVPKFDVVGLPDTAIKESRDRVCAALKNCGYEFPLGKITINLAPADVKKSGPSYDLPMLISLLCVTNQLNIDTKDFAFIGELSLNGEMRSINGILPMVIHAKEQGIKKFFLPEQNSLEASVINGIDIYAIPHVKDLIEFLIGIKDILPVKQILDNSKNNYFEPNFSEVKGQASAKRALEIAAAGGHNALLIGSPGSGKSMLAKRIPSILPEMTFNESIETTKIHSIAGLINKNNPFITNRPFRSPHHTISPAGLSGGGNIPRPGEISLAHNGVLFLDELPEFSRATMEILRQPMEDSTVTISRVNGRLTYPCSIMLIAAMNPCPCGYFGHPTRKCICSPNKVANYLSKVSGPLLDRLDLHIDATPVEFEHISSTQKSESSEEIKIRVDNARLIQNNRYKDTDIICNARIPSSRLQSDCAMSQKSLSLLKNAFDKMGLSARAYDRILKVSRTIADLDNTEIIQPHHIAEAIQYRSLDRKYWLSEI